MKSFSEKKMLLVAALILVIILASVMHFYFRPDRKASFRILFTGGMQGHIAGDDESLGYDSIKTLADALKEEGSELILLDGGNCLGGSEIAECDGGESIIKIMNETGYDAFVPGDLDYVYGLADLKKLRSVSAFPFISANVRDVQGKSVFEEYRIINTGKIRVCITGVCGELHPDLCSREGIEVADPSDSLSALASKLSSRVDSIIVLANIFDEGEIAQISDIKNVSLLILPSGDESYEETKDDGTAILSAREKGGCAGLIDISIARGKVETRVSYLDAAAVSSLATAPLESSQAVSLAYEKLEEAGREELGFIQLDVPEETVETEFYGEEYQETVETETQETEEPFEYNNEETPTGDLIADAMLSHSSKYGAKAAIVRDRSIHSALESGSIKRGDVYSLFDQDQYMIVCNMTGGELRKILEDSFSGYPRAVDFLQVSGMSYSYLSATKMGSPLSDISIDLMDMEDGASYAVAMCSDIAKDYDISPESGRRIISMKSLGTIVSDYISENREALKGDTKKKSEDDSPEEETRESEKSYRINIQ